MFTTIRGLLLALFVVALVAACTATAAGPGVATLESQAPGAVASASPSLSPEDALLAYAACMREHGIDMPDPTVGAGGEVSVQIGGPPGGPNDPGKAPDPKELDAANKACQHFMEEASKGFDPPSAEDQKKMQEQALAFAKCMRDHGIDMPDPQFSDGGGFSISVGAGPNGSAPTNNGPLVDFNSDEFKAANEACGGPDGGGFVISADPAAG